MRPAATNKIVSLRREPMRRHCNKYYFHILRLVWYFLLHKDNSGWSKKQKRHKSRMCQARNKWKVIKVFSCCDPIATRFKTEQLWRGGGNLGTSSHLGTVLSSDLWPFLLPPSHFSPASGLKVYLNSVFLEVKASMWCNKDLLALMFLHQCDKIWFLYISWFFKPYLQALL